MKPVRALAASFSYFSILPTRSFGDVPSAEAIAFLPVVGLVIGAISGLGAYATWYLTHSTVAMAIAAWLLAIALSGAIHVDGFLDCCDGLFAMVSPEKRLEIMRDPDHGTYAIVGMAMASAVWIYALTQIPPSLIFPTSAITGIIGRIAGSSVAGRTASGIPLAVVILWAYFVMRWAPALVALAIETIVVAPVVWFAARRLGGARSGDVFGAVIVVGEITLLLAVPSLLLLR